MVIVLEDIFLGGLETAGTLLNWSILFMVLNPTVQAKARQEILGKMATHTGFLSAMELKKYEFCAVIIIILHGS